MRNDDPSQPPAGIRPAVPPPGGNGGLVRNCSVCGVQFRTSHASAKTCLEHRKRKMARHLTTAVKRQTAERLVTAEDVLLRGYTPERAAVLLSKEWGITAKKAQQDYVEPVLKLWSSTASGEDREKRRDRLRARFEDAYRRAATKRTLRKRTQVVPGEDGKPKVVSTTEEVDAPDFKAMAAFGRLLMEIDGLGTVNVNATHAHVISTAMAEVMARRRAVQRQERMIEAKIVELNTDPLDRALGLGPPKE